MVVPRKPFNFAALEVQVRKAARLAFQEVASAHPEDQLCAFALYSDDGAMTVCPSINTTSHLAAMQRQHPGESPLRMAPAPRGFATFKRALFETCLRVLETLRKDRLFAGVMLVFAVSDTDSSARRELAMIKRLNDKAVVDEFRRWTKTWAP
jgi:hypothetical protein